MKRKFLFLFIISLSNLIFITNIYAISANSGGQTVSGISMNYTVEESTSFRPTPPAINKIGLHKADEDAKTVPFYINFTSNNDSWIEIRDMRTDVQLCISSQSSSNNQQCTSSYDDDDIKTPYSTYAYVCNDYYCEYKFYWFDPTTAMYTDATQIKNGLKLQSTISLQVLGAASPSYVSPTPDYTVQMYNPDNFTIKVHNGGTSISSCDAQIDGVNYSMSYVSNYCTYTYSFSDINTIQNVSFKVYYTSFGLTSTMAERSFTLYPPKGATGNGIPAVSIISIICTATLILVSIALRNR